MAIVQEMKSLCDRIVGDFEARVNSIGDLISQTQEIQKDARHAVKKMAEERAKMGEELRKDLKHFAKGLASSTVEMLGAFKTEHKKMANAQKKDLTQFAASLKDTTQKMLKDFKGSRAEMSSALKKELHAFVRHTVNEVKRLAGETQKYMQEQRDDIAGAKDAWGKMSKHMAKAREGGEVSEASPEGEVKKPRRRGRRRK